MIITELGASNREAAIRGIMYLPLEEITVSDSPGVHTGFHGHETEMRPSSEYRNEKPERKARGRYEARSW